MFWGCTAWFVSDLVRNPEDRFSHNEANFTKCKHQRMLISQQRIQSFAQSFLCRALIFPVSIELSAVHAIQTRMKGWSLRLRQDCLGAQSDLIDHSLLFVYASIRFFSWHLLNGKELCQSDFNIHWLPQFFWSQLFKAFLA